MRAGLLPGDKVQAVRDLEAAGRKVLLAGDGINDAPALAAASTGAAMGRAGSDLALDTADIVIMRDDLAAIPAVIRLSRRARRVVTANLVIAAAIITALVTWDLAGHLPAAARRAGPRGLHRRRRTQRPAAAARPHLGDRSAMTRTAGRRTDHPALCTPTVTSICDNCRASIRRFGHSRLGH